MAKRERAEKILPKKDLWFEHVQKRAKNICKTTFWAAAHILWCGAVFFPSVFLLVLSVASEDIDAINYKIRSFVNMTSGHHVRLML